MNFVPRKIVRLAKFNVRAAGWILAATSVLAATPMFAGTLAVTTNPSCEPAYVHFTTIQAAVAAAPSVGTTTILVCPGTYPEQVSIVGKQVVLRGVAYAGSNAAIISSPAGGLVQNATSVYGGGIEAQIFAQDTNSVAIEEITTDASNANLDSLGCTADPIGIFFQNASGAIERVSVLNDILSPSLTGCQGGLGIYVESGSSQNPPAGSSTVTIAYNSVENYQKNGITANGVGTAVTITSNVVVGQGPWNGAGQNSIQVAFGATGSVKSNTVGSDVWAPDVFGDTGDAAAGILVGYGSENVTISSNQVSNTQYGIAVEGDPTDGAGDGAQVIDNVVTLTHLYDAIDLCANNSTATGNKITGADESGVHIDDTCYGSATGNTVSSNTISGACAGILSGPASGNTIGTNTYFNAVSEIVKGSDICIPPPVGGVRKLFAKSHGGVRPARP
jgi:hypothetical protein